MRLSRVQMTLGTKVLFVHPCFGMDPVSLLLLLGVPSLSLDCSPAPAFVCVYVGGEAVFRHA